MTITTDEHVTGVDRLSQTEANYVTVAKSADASCATCRWFDKATDYCGIVKATPSDIVSEGSCDRHEAKAGASEPVAVAVVEAKAVKADEPAPVEAVVTATVADSEGAIQKFVKTVKQVFTPKPDTNAFQVFKALDNKHYWLARFTNNFEDRDKEILSAKAHESYVARVNQGFVSPPELWMYHTKGTRHGQADQVWMHAGFVFALGHFDDTPEAQQAIKNYQAQKGKIELSHGFTFPKWALKDGVYETYNTFEISTLPENAASNPFTSFEEIDNMARTEKQEHWIKKIGGDALLKRVQDSDKVAENDGDVLKALDVNRKSYTDFVEVENKTTDTPSESIEAGVGGVNELVVKMIGDQAEMMEIIDNLKAEVKTLREGEIVAYKANDDKVTELAATVKALQAQLDARPKSASTSEETKIDKSNLPEEVTASMVKRDGFWGVEVKETP